METAVMDVNGRERDLLPIVGAAMRESPLSHHLAAYIDKRGSLVIIMKSGARGIAPAHESAVVGMLVRLVREADALSLVAP